MNIDELVSGIPNFNSGKEVYDKLVEKFGNLDKELIVSVLDNSNYRNGESTPFRAKLIEIEDNCCFYVTSLVTGRDYELYYDQIKINIM